MGPKCRVRALAALLVVWGCVAAVTASDWPQFRGPDRDGKSDETGLLQAFPDGGPPLLWDAEGLGKGYGSAAIADGRIYVTGMVGRDGVLFCFDTKGKLLWKTTYGPEWAKGYPGSRTTPTVVGTHLYLISGVGRVVCADARTGKILWFRDAVKEYGAKIPSWGIAESPLVDGDLVYATPGGSKASVIALDRKTGKTVWASAEVNESHAYCSPILIERGGTRLLVTMLAKSIIALDPKTGKLLWRHPHKTSYDVHAVSPVYEDGRLYCTSGYGTGGVELLLSPNGKTVEPAWRDKTLDNHHGGVLLLDGYIYGTAFRGKWVCLEFRTGAVMVNARCPIGKGAVVYADGRILGYGENGLVGLVPPNPKQVRIAGEPFRITQGSAEHWAHPSIADGVLYIRHGDAMMAFDIRAK